VGTGEHVGPIEHVGRGEASGEVRVGGHRRVHARRVGAQRVVRVHHRGPWVEVDHHALGRIDRGRERLGHHHGNDLADVAHHVVGEQRPVHAGHHAGDGPAHRQAELAGTSHRDHARHGRRLVGVDRADDRARLRGAHEHRVQRGDATVAVDDVGDVEVADVARRATQERRVLLSQYPVPWCSAHGPSLGAAPGVSQQPRPEPRPATIATCHDPDTVPPREGGTVEAPAHTTRSPPHVLR
jgi:hypothetical protein